MNKITLVYAYYENAKMLERHLLEWNKYNHKNSLKIIIVDDCSPTKPAKDIIYDVGIEIELFRIDEQIPWNQDGARNLAMKKVKGWALLLDMDLMLGADELENLLNCELDINFYYNSLRRNQKTNALSFIKNSFLITSKMYWELGGYDEALAGYYGSDAAFIKRLKRRFGEPEISPMILTDFNGIINDSSTLDFGRTHSKYGIKNNFFLRLRRKIAPKPIKPINFKWHSEIEFKGQKTNE